MRTSYLGKSLVPQLLSLKLFLHPKGYYREKCILLMGSVVNEIRKCRIYIYDFLYTGLLNHLKV